MRVYAIEYPVIEYSPVNRRAEKFLYRLCMENKISFFIVRNIKYYSGSSLEHLESRIKRGDTDEIKAVKDMAALIKLSLEKNSNLLNKKMCFIGESYGYRYINTMLEEAAGVFIYEHSKMSDSFKRAIFEKLMSERGISAVFTKDLDRAISQCDIIAADGSIGLEAYKSRLDGKILIGNNTVSGDFEKIEKVLLV